MNTFTPQNRAGLSELAEFANFFLKSEADGTNFVEIAIAPRIGGKFGPVNADVLGKIVLTPHSKVTEQQQDQLCVALCKFIQRCNTVLAWPNGQEPPVDVPEPSVEELQAMGFNHENSQKRHAEEQAAAQEINTAVEALDELKSAHAAALETLANGFKDATAPDGTPLFPACGGGV